MKTSIFYILITIFFVSLTPVVNPQRQKTVVVCCEDSLIVSDTNNINWRDSVRKKRAKLFAKEAKLKQLLKQIDKNEQ